MVLGGVSIYKNSSNSVQTCINLNFVHDSVQ
jgi:hypothetical protein